MTFRNHWHLSEEFGPDGTDDGAMNSTVCYPEQQAVSTFFESVLEALKQNLVVDYSPDEEARFDVTLIGPADGRGPSSSIRYHAWPASEHGDLSYCVSAGYADESDLIARHESRHAFMASLRGPVVLYGDVGTGKTAPSSAAWSAAVDFEVNADLTLQAVTAAQPGPFVCPDCGVTYDVVHGCLGADAEDRPISNAEGVALKRATRDTVTISLESILGDGPMQIVGGVRGGQPFYVCDDCGVTYEDEHGCPGGIDEDGEPYM